MSHLFHLLIASSLLFLQFKTAKRIATIKWYHYLIFLLNFLGGAYLFIKGGLVLDYGTNEEVITSHAWRYYSAGLILWASSLILGLIKLIIFLFQRINKHYKT